MQKDTEPKMQVCAVEVNEVRKFSITAVYCAPGKEVDIGEIKNIIEGIQQPIILTRNCHHN